MDQNSRVFYLVSFKKKSGGSLYGRYLGRVKEVRLHHLVYTNIRNKPLKLIVYLFRLLTFQLSRKTGDTMIYNQDNCFFMKKNDKNILLAHHYHPISKNFLIRYYQRFLHRHILLNRNKFDLLVVVSQYWRDFYHNEGFEHIKVIYNPFDIEQYASRSEEEKNAFKRKYGLEEKPIIYLGNPQQEKGADKALRALEGLDAHFVTTGIKRVDLPAKHLELSFDEYILLLQVAHVSVLMSQMKEGWNRVAHESILCQTPVVGTGLGGMGELLQQTNQTICNDWVTLKRIVHEMIGEKRVVSEDALAYVRSFDVEKFENAWREVLKA